MSDADNSSNDRPIDRNAIHMIYLETLAGRQPALNEQEQQVVARANTPTEGHIQVALARAARQFEGFPVVPEDENLFFSHPDLDPLGKYSTIDMKFARREAVIQEALQSRTPEVQRYVQDMLNVIHAPYHESKNHQAAYTYQAMQDVAKEHRDCSRAAKLCKDKEGRRLLYQRSRDLETNIAVVECDKMVQGLEYAAGLRPGPVPEEIQACWRDHLHAPLDLKLVERAQKINPDVKTLNVKFGDLDNSALQRALSASFTWGKSREEIQQAIQREKDTLSAEHLHSYAVATVKRVIDPIYSGPEQTSNGIADRGGLIIVDGRTVREIMQENYSTQARLAGANQTQSFEDYYKANLTQTAGELVSSALVAGKRVEAFLPDAKGNISREPVQLVKTGYEPSPLQPEKFSRWQRFFSKFGYYKEKVNRQKEYEKAMDARKRVQADNRVARLKDLAARRYDYSKDPEDLFFEPILEEKDFLRLRFGERTGSYVQVNDWERMQSHMEERGAQGSFANFVDNGPACCACICYMALQGHKYQDIIDPNKLQAERLEAARLFVERGEANDQTWLGQVVYHGQKAILQQANTLVQGLDLRDEAQLMSVLPELESMAASARAAGWDMHKVPEFRRSYLAAATADARAAADNADTRDDTALGEERASQLSSTLSYIRSFSQSMLGGMITQLKWADPSLGIGTVDGLTDLYQLERMRVLTDQIREGNSLMDKLPDQTTANTMVNALSTASDDPIRETVNRQGDAIRQLAASGELVRAMVVETSPPKFGNTPELNIKLELPAPGAERQAPQRQEPQRQPPQRGGLGL